MSELLPFILLWPLICALGLIFFFPRRGALWNVVASLGLWVLSIWLWQQVWNQGTLLQEVGGWKAPFGILLVSDLFSASMVLITGFTGFCVALYIYFEDRKRSPEETSGRYFAAYQTLLMGVCGSFLTGDLFNLYVWFEVMLLSSFVMVAFEGRKAQLEGGLKYTILNLVASNIFLVAVGLLYAAVGTLNMAHLGQVVSQTGATPAVQASFVLLLIAFGMKAGVFPLFFWLPASYHTPRVATSAILAGLLTKVGVYSLIRVCTLIFPTTLDFLQPLLVGVACLTMLTGVLGAAFHYDIRRILSFHIISQIGYMILGLAIWTPAALAAAIFYVLHHIVVKTNLFLIGGIIEDRTGTADLKKIGGLVKVFPLLGFLFLIPALSLGGIPPLSGFFAKFALIRSGLIEEHFVAMGVALFVGLLTLFSMTKIWLEGFWKTKPHELSLDSSPGGWKLLMLPVALMALVTVVLGLWPEVLLGPADRMARELLDPQGYIRLVLGRMAP
jgi:multicomponent Na+:H+ antiporter subunit D